MPPYVPYPISGVVYESYITDSSQDTAVASVNVRVYNLTNKEYSDWYATNSSGQYTIDLANLGSGYVNGDIIFIESEIGTGINNASAAYKHTVDTVVGSVTQDHYLHEGRQPEGSGNITSSLLSNLYTTVGNVTFYDRSKGRVILRQNVGSNALGISPFYSEDPGKRCPAGYFMILSVKTLSCFVDYR